MSPAENALFAYTFVAIVWAFAFGGYGLINLNSREEFARGILCGPVWPLMLLWWARPSWLWRDGSAADRARRAEELAELDRLRAEVERLNAERGGFR